MAAAGSGKTYLAAFDALNFNPKRLLYIVHEGSILKKSLETFSNVFGNSVTYGIFSGEHKEMDADFVFATNITMCKSLELFAKNEFDISSSTNVTMQQPKHTRELSVILNPTSCLV